MKNSIAKRIKVTKKGKIIRRKMSTDHFKTRKTNKNLRKKRKLLGLNFPKKNIFNI